MRYFAKYLPVEGKIGIGDYGMNSAGSIYQCYAANRKTKKDKKVQLFLCSRDIQVGDRYYNVNHDAWDICETEYMLEQIKESNIKDGILRLKALAPISPHAIWIKDGDDILSKDVRRGTYRRGYRGDCWLVVDCQEGPVEEWEKLGMYEWKKCYLIEGPCGHMH